MNRGQYSLKAELRGHGNSVSAVRFSPDGRWVASASADKTARLWHVAASDDDGGGGATAAAAAADAAATLAGHTQGLNDVAWTSDARYAATASDDQTVRLWDAARAEELRALRGHSAYVFCVRFNAQGNLCVSGGYDETVRLWDVRTGRAVRVLNAHADPITAVDFNNDGTLIATASYDGLCRVWDVANGTCLKTIVDDDENPPVGAARFSPNGRYLLCATLDSTLRLWNFEQAKCVGIYRGHTNEKFCSVPAFSVTAEHSIVSGSEDGAVFVWSLRSQRVAQTLHGHTGVVLGVDAHPTRNIIASCAAAPDNTVRLWHLQQQQQQ